MFNFIIKDKVLLYNHASIVWAIAMFTMFYIWHYFLILISRENMVREFFRSFICHKLIILYVFYFLQLSF
ncbi:hypothetical protein GLOIN_2v1725027 [Rhizophagus irregularis DAOM 181602=DAOM 197198]|uniref:Uncharacterized protein n=1 Tax=Rhizophagus irregularis (strain DAOM 181602 / DAOM 197198 / MUCL 43194) TaxID=747089 RepID=A0A2P4P176_RHIID|nr:hypothetical protein GLOIN_2v1725027 [Rhizophagus irregularis DAOM 181602=DAOM 197198]POG59108.1 hypothetical protein GLOIN_2v1725027 [Rhizophagus irregularis DAOM 181602=DAOM 197198]GET61780.1 hypothetical protein GLOIN_2v1725027 [Rhizophagus irregularis DAOM 181602=DAOM 197198]|eukprot:XP_025165974.1 hypothetical protein GLOIN_2v1725027 [Rhizophagus irregularis DAOM 181602=DAOM 197198]